jgi:hypothetical protein
VGHGREVDKRHIVAVIEQELEGLAAEANAQRFKPRRPHLIEYPAALCLYEPGDGVPRIGSDALAVHRQEHEIDGVRVHHRHEPEPSEVGIGDDMLELGLDPDVGNVRREVTRDRYRGSDPLSCGLGTSEQCAAVRDHVPRGRMRELGLHLLARQLARGAQSKQRVPVTVGHPKPTMMLLRGNDNARVPEARALLLQLGPEQIPRKLLGPA